MLDSRSKHDTADTGHCDAAMVNVYNKYPLVSALADTDTDSLEMFLDEQSAAAFEYFLNSLRVDGARVVIFTGMVFVPRRVATISVIT